MYVRGGEVVEYGPGWRRRDEMQWRMGEREVHVYATLNLQITYNYKDGNYLQIVGQYSLV